MATDHVTVTRTPTDIVAAKSLTRGNRYSVQNSSGGRPIYFHEGSTAPDATTRSRTILSPLEKAPYLIPASDNVYVWTDVEDEHVPTSLSFDPL